MDRRRRPDLRRDVGTSTSRRTTPHPTARSRQRRRVPSRTRGTRSRSPTVRPSAGPQRHQRRSATQTTADRVAVDNIPFPNPGPIVPGARCRDPVAASGRGGLAVPERHVRLRRRPQVPADQRRGPQRGDRPTASDICLDGDIENPIGQTYIKNTRGDIFTDDANDLDGIESPGSTRQPIAIFGRPGADTDYELIRTNKLSSTPTQGRSGASGRRRTASPVAAEVVRFKHIDPEYCPGAGPAADACSTSSSRSRRPATSSST